MNTPLSVWGYIILIISLHSSLITTYTPSGLICALMRRPEWMQIII